MRILRVAAARFPRGVEHHDVRSRAGAVGEVEVRDHDVSVFPEHDILRLQVAVDEAHQVQVLQRNEHLGGVETRDALGETLPGRVLQSLVQFSPLAELHDEVQVRLRLERAVQRGAERVVHSLQNCALGLHAVQLVAVAHLLLRQNLHGEQRARMTRRRRRNLRRNLRRRQLPGRGEAIGRVAFCRRDTGALAFSVTFSAVHLGKRAS
mmetsp:Transcript_2535/g.9991  ORF Transcript_2535/g.9991 Transcript_2535/m.9991 type:complete len:208 (+) Transcript_2535:1671-2294(+)